jgi:hypothetical protein
MSITWEAGWAPARRSGRVRKILTLPGFTKYFFPHFSKRLHWKDSKKAAKRKGVKRVDIWTVYLLKMCHAQYHYSNIIDCHYDEESDTSGWYKCIYGLGLADALTHSLTHSLTSCINEVTCLYHHQYQTLDCVDTIIDIGCSTLSQADMANCCSQNKEWLLKYRKTSWRFEALPKHVACECS